MATMPRGEPRSVPDPAGEAYDAMIKSTRGARGTQQSFGSDGGRLDVAKMFLPGTADDLDAVRDYVRRVERFPDDPVVAWAQAHVGGNGYRQYNRSPESRGRLDSRLPAWMRGVGDPKCNRFVWDALSGGGRPPGRVDGGRIPVAREWGEPGTKIDGYIVVDGPPKPGDVISNGHHVGIYAPMDNGQPGTISAATILSPQGGWRGNVVHNDWGSVETRGRLPSDGMTESRDRGL